MLGAGGSIGGWAEEWDTGVEAHDSRKPRSYLRAARRSPMAFRCSGRAARPGPLGKAAVARRSPQVLEARGRPGRRPAQPVHDGDTQAGFADGFSDNGIETGLVE